MAPIGDKALRKLLPFGETTEVGRLRFKLLLKHLDSLAQREKLRRRSTPAFERTHRAQGQISTAAYYRDEKQRPDHEDKEG